MEERGKQEVRKINYLTSEMEGLYHQASRKLGISDSVSRVLYTLCDEGDPCPLSIVYKKAGISKQTIHSAIRSLEAEGILSVYAEDGRTKWIALTPKGKLHAQNTAGRLFHAEMRAFDGWSAEEVGSYLHLMEKYTQCLRQQIEQL